MNSEKNVREVKEMASNVNFSEEEFKRITEENKAHDELFQNFHKEAFNKMQDESMFLACHILDKEGQKPGDKNFEKEFPKLVKEIMKQKIELFGNFLK